jgi:single-stranded-DNA-specific exonuclease
LGPRINTVSRIQGDAHFCVELLTSQDEQKARSLADDTELANARRKALQKDVTEQVQAKLVQLDLSTTGVIVLWDEQWNPGVLGLVAGQIAQEYGRPTILLSVDSTEQMARGSARSTQQIDLYQLVKDQAHLLHRFGGHPFAAGLSLAIDNLPLFTQAINQRLLQQIGTADSITPTLQVDLSVTVAELGLELYKELRWIEPCGMGNPIPRLLIQNCWFEANRNYKLKDWQGRKIDYIRTPFKIFDESIKEGFHGIWWGHYAYEIPQGRCDAIVELENNTYNKRYEVRLVDVRPCQDSIDSTFNPNDWLLDWRTEKTPTLENPIEVSVCPTSWEELQAWVRRAVYEQRPLAIAYPPPTLLPPSEIWQNLVGIAKYLSRTGKTVTRKQWCDRLEIGDLSLKAGFQALNAIGFRVQDTEQKFRVSIESEMPLIKPEIRAKIEQFLAAVREEQFRRQYFAQIPILILQAICLANARAE